MKLARTQPCFGVRIALGWTLPAPIRVLHLRLSQFRDALDRLVFALLGFFLGLISESDFGDNLREQAGGFWSGFTAAQRTKPGQ